MIDSFVYLFPVKLFPKWRDGGDEGGKVGKKRK